MCSPSPPPAPDPVVTANAQGAANEAAARVTGHLSNPNVVGPQGSRTVTWNGDDPTVTNTLSPDELRLYQQGLTNRSGLGSLAGQGIDSLRGTIGSRFDMSGMPAGGTALQAGALPTALSQSSLPGAPTAYRGASNLPAMPVASDQLRKQVIDAQMLRSNSAIDKQQENTQADLISRGLRPGTEAYQREMDAVGRQRNDAQAQAEANATSAVQAAFGEDMQRRQQGYQEGITDANTSFGQGMALRTNAAGEQAQRFGQEGQNVQEGAALQNQTYGQQQDIRRQAIAEALARRQVPLNEITALMSGSQVGGSPASGGQGSPFAGSTVAPAPIAGSLANQQAYNTDLYNQQVGQSNTNTAAGAAVAAAAIAAMF